MESTQQLISSLLALVSVLQSSMVTTPQIPPPEPTPPTAEQAIVASLHETQIPLTVPFYSQFNDISDPNWKKVGCGITSLAMLIDFYKPAVPVDTLLSEGVAAGAYLDSAGWTYAGLIGVSEKYGLSGSTHDYGASSMDNAFSELTKALEAGPVMASVYYTLTPGHPIPHLIVVNEVRNGLVYYNDPANDSGGNTISVEQFKPAWKKRYIEFHPVS